MTVINRGRLETIPNLDAKQGSNQTYRRVLVWNVDTKQWTNLLLTEAQVLVAIERAIQNPEDETQPTWLDKLI